MFSVSKSLQKPRQKLIFQWLEKWVKKVPSLGKNECLSAATCLAGTLVKAEALKSGVAGSKVWKLLPSEVAGDFLVEGVGDDLDAAGFGNIGGINDADGVGPLFCRGDEVE